MGLAFLDTLPDRIRQILGSRNRRIPDNSRRQAHGGRLSPSVRQPKLARSRLPDGTESTLPMDPREANQTVR